MVKTIEPETEHKHGCPACGHQLSSIDEWLGVADGPDWEWACFWWCKNCGTLAHLQDGKQRRWWLPYKVAASTEVANANA